MGKSESRFDLNRDFNTTWDSIWLLKIRFRPTGFGIRFANFRDSIWSCKIWEPNPWITNVYAAHVLVGPFPFHFINTTTTWRVHENTSSATKELKCQLGWRRDVPGAATYKWPTRDILGVNPVGRLSNPATADQEVPEHFGNFCQRRTVLREQSFVLAATDYRQLLLSHCCSVCSNDSLRACSHPNLANCAYWKLIKQRSLTGMRFDWDLRFVYWRFEIQTFLRFGIGIWH